MSLKNPVTPPGIETETIRLEAQRVNHYATLGYIVCIYIYIYIYTIYIIYVIYIYIYLYGPALESLQVQKVFLTSGTVLTNSQTHPVPCSKGTGIFLPEYEAADV